MDYNSQNSSAYERPFVTLVRYDGNNPGYSYVGDANTAPIAAVNDTRERALINSFNFTTVAWASTQTSLRVILARTSPLLQPLWITVLLLPCQHVADVREKLCGMACRLLCSITSKGV